MKFAALGRTHWLYDSIQACVRAGHEAVLIGTAPASPEYTVSEKDFLALAKRLNCPAFADSRLQNPTYSKWRRNTKADVAISVNWPTLIPASVLNSFKHGVINVHAGDLPRFRGNACPNWAILTGQKKVTVTLHRMVPELDAGPILLQRSYALKRTTYIADVYDFMTRVIPDMFAECLGKLEKGGVVGKKQSSNPKQSLRCFPRRPEDAEIQWDQPAMELERLVRASSEPFAGAYTFLDGGRLTVWKAHAETLPYPHLGVPGQIIERRSKTKEVGVLTGYGVLFLEEIQFKGGRRSSATDLLSSTRQRLGPSSREEIRRLRSEIARLKGTL